MRPAAPRPAALALLLVALLAAAALAQAPEQPLAAGSEGVPVPKKTKHVQPVYPAEALAQGIRGIVILDIVVDVNGKVASTSVLRSVPGLDEAAIAAARQWEYEPTKIDGKPVSVRLTVPITFSLSLPRLLRDTGVPELRQGVAPSFPAGASSGGTATAEVTLEADGRVASANLLSGEAPWSQALLAALKTWRFAPPPDDAVLTFRVEAVFVKARGSEANSVQLHAGGLQRSDLIAESPAPSAPAAAPAASPSAATPQAAPPAAAPPAAAAPGAEAPAAAAPGTAPAAAAASQAGAAAPGTGEQAPSSRATAATAPPAAGAPAPAAQAPAAAVPPPAASAPASATPKPAGPPATPPPSPTPGATTAAAPQRPAAGTSAAAPAPVRPPATAAPSAPSPGAAPAREPAAASPPAAAAAPDAASAPAAPSVDVITAPAPAPPPESGLSAVRDVTLEAGVPELTRGRRPVPPPFARLNSTTGTVEVTFSVSAGGVTALQAATGPDLLRYAAQQTVASWVFRRTRADRAYLVAQFTYGNDKASAVVRPQAAPPAAAPTAAAPPPPTP